MKRKFYLNIGDKKLVVTKKLIEKLFGCFGVVADSFNHNTRKFAFYNTGQLCQVSFINGSSVIEVRVADGTDSRKEDILGWLETYLGNGLREMGYGLQTFHYNGYFLALISK